MRGANQRHHRASVNRTNRQLTRLSPNYRHTALASRANSDGASPSAQSYALLTCEAGQARITDAIPEVLHLPASQSSDGRLHPSAHASAFRSGRVQSRRSDWW